MKNIKQTLSEELNKMQFLLGYQRGMVISEQKQNIRQRVESEGFNWVNVKSEFGSSGTLNDNTLLSRAWSAGWRPGNPVPDNFQTPAYKQKALTTATTTVPSTTVTTTVPATVVAGSDQANDNPLKDFSSEDLQKKIEDTKQKTKEAKEQNKIDESICKDTADVVDSKGFLGFKKINTPVADQQVCDVLRYCITKGFIKNNRTRNFSACDAFPAKVTTETTTVAPLTTQTTTVGSTFVNRPTAG